MRRLNKEQWSWVFYDWANSGYGIIVTTAVLPIYFKGIAEASGVTAKVTAAKTADPTLSATQLATLTKTVTQAAQKDAQQQAPALIAKLIKQAQARSIH